MQKGRFLPTEMPSWIWKCWLAREVVIESSYCPLYTVLKEILRSALRKIRVFLYSPPQMCVCSCICVCVIVLGRVCALPTSPKRRDDTVWRLRFEFSAFLLPFCNNLWKTVLYPGTTSVTFTVFVPVLFLTRLLVYLYCQMLWVCHSSWCHYIVVIEVFLFFLDSLLAR